MKFEMKGEIKVLLLDMNGTFMFGGDRFGPEEDYSVHFRSLGGKLDANLVNELINSVYDDLLEKYPDPEYRESFPSLEYAFEELSGNTSLELKEMEHLVNTFAHHELGKVPQEYSETIRLLSEQYYIGLVADIWSPKNLWIDEFERAGILDCFDILLFSSDSGIVKPSRKLFMNALEQLGVEPEDVLVVGDSPRRDLGGALAAGLECVLVGGKTHPDAHGTASDFLEFSNSIL